ncbi:MAG: site-2 protease family protein [Kofleriaceae bacterium]
MGEVARSRALSVGTFAACCVTTAWFGGVAFAATLMTILLCHEMGHYVAARHHGVEVSPPVFIPLPPQISLGTLGAVIRMPRPIASRDHLFDVGAAGPIAGLVVAIPLLVVGLATSTVGPVDPNGVLEGNSLLYGGLKLIVLGRWLPADGVDVQLSPMGFAAWVGLLITMINLIPIGQLDGGHVARAALGDRHERLSARLHVGLVVFAVLVGGVLLALARVAGRGWGGALAYAGAGCLPWLLWAAMILLMRRAAEGSYHPEVGDAPLSAGRQRAAALLLVLFLLIFMPVPMRAPL